MNKLTFLLAVLALPAAAALPRPTAASFDKGAAFTVSGYAGQSPLSGFPVLVRLAPGAPSGFSYADLHSPSNGADLAFIDMEGNGLPFEIDTWDPQGTSLVWVKLPTMQNGTQFVMCWGSATDGKTVCADNPFSGYKGVWHMNETNVVDASGSGNGGTASGAVALTNGVVGAGLSYPNTDSYVSCGSSQAESELKGGYTVEGWVNLSSTSGTKALFGKSGFISYRMEGTAVKITTPKVKDYDNVNNFITAANEWHHFALSFVPNTTGGAKHYVDGALKATQNTTGINNQTGSIEMWLGWNQFGSGQGFTGLIDEYRLAPTLESADWIAATYATQSDPAFLVAGAATPYEATPAPQVGVALSDVQYTNATLAVFIGSLGRNDAMTEDASWADATLLVATEDAFALPVFSIPLARVSSAPASVSLTAVPLVTNTVYWAKVVATNSFDVAGESVAVSFTTLSPAAPSGTATFLSRGFTTLSASGAATAYGTGAQSTTMRLEVSADGFTNVVASAEVPAVAGAAETPLAVSNLVPATAYAMRLRIRNDWGLDTFVALPDAATRAVPFATTGIGWTFSPDGSTVDVTFGVSGIYDGATGSATLHYGEASNPTASQGTRSFAASTNLLWAALPVTAATMYAKVVLSATLAGTTYTQTFTSPIAAGSTSVAVSDIMDHASAATAVRVRPGDVITLPELSGSAHYILGNALFGSLEGNVLTALRPGILGIHCVGNDDATNTMAVLVLPEKIGNGNIYVFKEKSVSNHSCLWAEPQRWEKIGGETNESFPNGADDIAIIPYYDENSVQFDLHEDVVLAALYAGRWRDAAGNVSIRSLSSPTHGIAFERADGEPARIQLCPNAPLTGDNEFRAKLTIADSIPAIAFRTDTIISGGSDRADASYPQGRFAFDALLFDISEGATVSLVEMDTWETGAALATMGGGRLTGAGTFWNRSAAAIRFARNKTSFTGLLRDSGGYGHQAADRCGPTEIRSNSTNCTAETVGWVSVNASAQPNTWWKSGVGCVVVGHNHGHNAPPVHAGTNWFPRAAMLHGGWLQVLPEEKVWGEPGVIDRKYAQRLVAADGFSYFRGLSRDTSGGYPVNWFEADELVNENGATLRLDDSSFKASAASAQTNEVTILHGWKDVAVGPAGNPESSDSYPTVPWIVSPLDGGQDKLYFPAFDSSDRLVRPVLAASGTALASFSAGRNAYCRNAGIALAEDLTVNSLYLQNDTKGKTLGAGRTLTVTSGGLILSDVNDNNNPGSAAIGEEGGSENGALVLGDADHPAYVWACGATTSSANTAPNQIWAPVTAPGGFVHAYTGTLILGGNQTNILEELVVNAGTLQLGTAASPCRLGKKLPIRIFANATLRLPNADSTVGRILQFDGAAGWFGKIDLPDGVAAQCKKAFFRDYPEEPEWQSLERGFYGSSDSGVEALASATHPAFVRDDLFAGTGTLKVLLDDRIPPAMLILR